MNIIMNTIQMTGIVLMLPAIFMFFVGLVVDDGFREKVLIIFIPIAFLVGVLMLLFG